MEQFGFVDAKEAARIKGVSVSTIARWCAAGAVTCVKVGKTWLVEESALKAFEQPKRGPKPKRGRPPERKEGER